MRAEIAIITTVEGGPSVELKRLSITVAGPGPIRVFIGVGKQTTDVRHGDLLKVLIDTPRVA